MTSAIDMKWTPMLWSQTKYIVRKNWMMFSLSTVTPLVCIKTTHKKASIAKIAWSSKGKNGCLTWHSSISLNICKMLLLNVLLTYTRSPQGTKHRTSYLQTFICTFYSCGESSRTCCRIVVWPYLVNQSPWLFLISVDEISMRNFSSGMEMNMSLNSFGMSKSSRTFKQVACIYSIKWPLFLSPNVCKENVEVNSYLENSFNLSTTNKKSGTCAFTFEKYLQHSIVISSIILRLQWVNFIQYRQHNIHVYLCCNE